MTESNDLRRQRDALAESLTQIRGRLVCAIRDERLPESVRDLLVCLLHGQGIEDATQKGFQRQGQVMVSFDPATAWLRQAGYTGPVDEVVVKLPEA